MSDIGRAFHIELHVVHCMTAPGIAGVNHQRGHTLSIKSNTQEYLAPMQLHVCKLLL